MLLGMTKRWLTFLVIAAVAAWGCSEPGASVDLQSSPAAIATVVHSAPTPSPVPPEPVVVAPSSPSPVPAPTVTPAPASPLVTAIAPQVTATVLTGLPTIKGLQPTATIVAIPVPTRMPTTVPVPTRTPTAVPAGVPTPVPTPTRTAVPYTRPATNERGRAGFFVALDYPQIVSAQHATFLKPDELVLGLEIGGQARAYPARMAWYHHIFNDELGGVPALVTY